MLKIKNICSECECEQSKIEPLYKYNEKLYCWNCLESELCIDGLMSTETTTSYYLEGEYAGTNDDLNEVIDCLCNNYEVEEVED